MLAASRSPSEVEPELPRVVDDAGAPAARGIGVGRRLGLGAVYARIPTAVDTASEKR